MGTKVCANQNFSGKGSSLDRLEHFRVATLETRGALANPLLATRELNRHLEERGPTCLNALAIFSGRSVSRPFEINFARTM